MTPTVKAILDKYEGTPAAVKANLARILMQGRLGGTGKLIILPPEGRTITHNGVEIIFKSTACAPPPGESRLLSLSLSLS